MRVRKGAARKRAKRRLYKATKGFFQGRKRYRAAKETLVRAQAYATRDRRTRKRTFRSLWITRISGALSNTDLTYSRFMQGLKKANVTLNTKSLAEIALSDPNSFTKIVELARSSLQ